MFGSKEGDDKGGGGVQGGGEKQALYKKRERSGGKDVEEVKYGFGEGKKNACEQSEFVFVSMGSKRVYQQSFGDFFNDVGKRQKGFNRPKDKRSD